MKRPTFTIRDLLWLTTLLAVSLGWFMNSRSLVRNYFEETRYLRDANDSLHNENWSLAREKELLLRENTEMSITINKKNAMLRPLLEKEHKAIQERKEVRP
jgi:hypothetical protein